MAVKKKVIYLHVRIDDKNIAVKVRAKGKKIARARVQVRFGPEAEVRSTDIYTLRKLGLKPKHP